MKCSHENKLFKYDDTGYNNVYLCKTLPFLLYNLILIILDKNFIQIHIFIMNLLFSDIVSEVLCRATYLRFYSFSFLQFGTSLLFNTL